MPDETTILTLPLILAAQAQKHVTHNEALVKLDLIVQLSVLSRNTLTAPVTPVVGDRYIVGGIGTGAWAGQDQKIALYTLGGWTFTTALLGWQAYIVDESQMGFFDGTTWIALSDGPFTVARLGIGATPDATNRLSVVSPATLLNHAGAGHQVKVNKALATDTASLLFQTGFSGRAEMGTAGADDFALKVSADGTTFFSALVADRTNGRVTLPQPLLLGGQAADPSTPANGTLWLNTTTGEVKVRTNGATVVVGTGGGGGVTDGDKGDITVSASGATWTIDANAVGNSKLAQVATATIKGRATAGTGNVEDLTATQVRTILNVANGATANSADAFLLARANHTGTQAASTITGLAAVATSGSAADLTAGTLPAARFDDTAHGARAGGTLHAAATTTVAGFMSGADKTKLDGIATGANNYVHPNHSGDVTSVGDGATTIAAGAVTNAKLATMAANTVKVNATAATAAPTDLAVGTNTVLGRVAGNIVAAQLVDAQVAAATLTNAKLANVATATLKGRASAGTGSPEDLTGTQATALLDTFTSAAKGLAPASGGGTTNFLRADGTWAAPAGGGGVVEGTGFYRYFTDFMSVTTDVMSNQSAGTGASVVITAWPYGGNPPASGFMTGALGTTATGRAGWMSVSAIALHPRVGQVLFKARGGLRTLSDGTVANYVAEIGLMDTPSGVIANGMFFRYNHAVNGGRWQAICMITSVATTVDTGVSPVTTGVSTFEIRGSADGLTYTFFIDGTLVATITTNLPAIGTGLGFGVRAIRTVGTAATNVFTFDYMLLEQTFASRT